MERKIDWVIHYVANGAVCEKCGRIENGFINGFCNAHTHGMEKYRHPDFQLVLDFEVREICRILNTFCCAVQNGSRFHDGQYVTGIYEDCAVKLLEYEECGRKVLRVIIPDKANRFPDERDCELPYAMQLMETDAYNLFAGHEDACDVAEEVIVFIHDGIVEGVFATSADTHVCIVDFDKDSGDQDYENALWAACRKRGLNLIGPEFDHCDGA